MYSKVWLRFTVSVILFTSTQSLYLKELKIWRYIEIIVTFHFFYFIYQTVFHWNIRILGSVMKTIIVSIIKGKVWPNQDNAGYAHTIFG